MLYLALSGRLPFQGSTHEVLTQKMTAEPVPPAEIAPGVPADLNQLAIDLLRTDPLKRPEGFEILARLGIAAGPSSTRIARAVRFVGRSAELAAIEDAFAHTAAGEAVTLLVEGDSGVGKSWLVREFTRRAAAHHDALVFRGRCYERESLPYKAVDTLVDDLARFLSSLREEEAAALMPPETGALRAAFPVMGTIPVVRGARLTRADVRNPQEARVRMFEAFRTLLVNVALHRRLVLVIDDLQWADEDSLALLTDLLRVPGAPPLLVLASIRGPTDGASRGLSERLAHLPGDVRSIHLAPLPAADARELVQTLLAATHSPGHGDVSRDVDAICAEAKGHPLFIEEIVRYRAAHHAEGAEAAGDPTRLDDALWERARGLPPETRELLELVVVAGFPVPQDIIARAGALDFGKAFDAIGVLRAAHLVRTSGVYRQDTVEPYHDRVRESVLHHLDEPTRRRGHARLAHAFEASGNADPEQLIPHWVGAGETARAAELAFGAAESAAAALAFDHAASLYRLAIELEEPTGDRALLLKEKLAAALTNAGRAADAAAVYLDAAASAASLRAIDLRRRAAEHLVCSGRIDEGTRVLESVLQDVGVRAPRGIAAIVLSLLASRATIALRGFGFVPRPEASLDPLALLRVDCLLSAGPGFGMSDRIRGNEFQLRTLVDALKLGEPARVARALTFYGLAISSGGVATFDRVMEVQRIAESMARDLKQPYFEAMAAGVTAFAYFLTGRPRESLASFEQTEAILRDQCVGVAYELSSTRMLRYRALAWLGELTRLAPLVAATLRDAEQRGDIYTVVSLRATAVLLLALARDDLAGADRGIALVSAQLSTRGFHVQHFYATLARVLVLLYRGDGAGAEAVITKAMPIIKRSMLLRVQNIRVLLHEAHARACIVVAASPASSPPAARAARKTAEQLAKSLEGEGWVAATAHASLLRAALRRGEGDLSGAINHLAAAERGFASLGMALHDAVARRSRGLLLGESGGSALVASSEAWMAGEGVRSPSRISALLAPGVAL